MRSGRPSPYGCQPAAREGTRGAVGQTPLGSETPASYEASANPTQVSSLVPCESFALQVLSLVPCRGDPFLVRLDAAPTNSRTHHPRVVPHMVPTRRWCRLRIIVVSIPRGARERNLTGRQLPRVCRLVSVDCASLPFPRGLNPTREPRGHNPTRCRYPGSHPLCLGPWPYRLAARFLLCNYNGGSRPWHGAT